LFGIHGPALLAAIVLPVYLNFQVENTAAFHDIRCCRPRRGLHVHVRVPRRLRRDIADGPADATQRVPRLRTFALATLLPSLINTNEPVMFGLPLVYNPVLGIRICSAAGAGMHDLRRALVPSRERAIYYLPSTLPMFVNVFLATLDGARSCCWQ